LCCGFREVTLLQVSNRNHAWLALEESVWTV
jgi:hypothetical protein